MKVMPSIGLNALRGKKLFKASLESRVGIGSSHKWM